MNWRRATLLLALLALAAGRCAGEIASLAGTWRLDVKKSSWSALRRPEMVVLHIEHREPNVKFEGAVQHANEETREFAFSGAIDGKPYPAQRSFGPGTVVLKRVNDWTVSSRFQSAEGGWVETAEITVARGGRTLTQRIHLATPSGKRTWTEVYQRRPAP